jgi:undecaprenyl-diphosphatase
MAGGTLLNFVLKQIFAAPRPDLLPHLDIVHSYSFPSGHAAYNMMLFGALAMLSRRRIGYVLAGMVIALIGISRVWLGVHWPSDVLAGWITGFGWLCLCRHWLPARGGEQQRIT